MLTASWVCLFVCRIRECSTDATIELIFCCTTFYMQLMHARIGVSEMRVSYGHFTVTSGHYSHPQIGEYGHAIRLNTVTLVTSGWCDSDHKGHPFKVNVLTLCGYIGQPKNMTTVTMPQQRGEREISIPVLALWSGFWAKGCQRECHDNLFQWCYQWQSHWHPCKLGSGQKVFTGSILDVTGRHWAPTWILGPTRGSRGS